MKWTASAPRARHGARKARRPLVSGAAQRAGIHVGDQILGVNDALTSTVDDFDSALATVRSNDVVAMLVVRGTLRSFVAVDRR
ncbi:PDZ domain-containing protein [Variovorax robiniae]|uniref:PDZ domain-containing protein n=1 Tax=Variovorax robiniae TaxID=1836199 RepID=UPI003BF5038D